jgi:hypothetical protein
VLEALRMLVSLAERSSRSVAYDRERADMKLRALELLDAHGATSDEDDRAQVQARRAAGGRSS